MIFERDKPDQSDNPPSLPLIFPKNQYSHQQSHKSLYKNDSQSSHHTINPQNVQLHLDKSLRQSLNPKHSFVSNDLQNSASIKKYLKKGDEFNKFNAQKIFKIENGLEENALKNYLYKIPKDFSINRFPQESQLQQKSNEKSLKKIYISSTKGKKSNSSRLDKLQHRGSKRFSTMSKMSQPKQLKQLVNQEVQTDKMKVATKPKPIKPQEKTIVKTSPRINTLEVLEKSKTQKLKNQKSSLNMSKFINLSSILQKDEEQVQPPKKLNSIRHNHLQTKYLINQSFTGQQSTAPSTYTNTYLSSMSKLSSNFNSEIEKIKKNRYDFSEMSQKSSPQKYSRTIDVGSNVEKNLDLSQNSPKNNDFQPELPRSIKSKKSSPFPKKSEEKKAKGHDISIQVSDQQFKKMITQKKDSEPNQEDRKVMSLSVVPQQSQTMNSMNSQSAFEPFSALSIVNQEKQDNLHQQNSKQLKKDMKTQNTTDSREKPKPRHHKKKDEIMQFPQISQLKISPMQNYQENTQRKTIHPIRNNFNQKGISWITDSYHPKSKLFDFINVETFIIKKYRNGVYFGQIENDKKHGTGVIFYYNGKLYEGSFVSDLKEGEGYEEFPDGSKYQGHFKGGVKYGKGIFEWSNGEVYEGEWFNGKKHGSGIWKSAQGQSYIGEWNNGKAQGFGVYISKLGDRYQGQFYNSQKHGFGTQRYHNGQTYVGQYRRNRPNGQGQYFWTNGNYYKGEFVNHLRHGEGYFKDLRTGEEYKGEYRNDKKCGFGELRSGEENYVGNFENDYRHGYGELYVGQVCKGKGYWVNGRFLDEDQGDEHDENCPQNNKNNRIHPISEKPELQNHKTNARINQINKITQNKQLDQGRSSLAKSRSPHNNKSIESYENNSLEKSNYKRSCGCTRKH